MGSIWLHDLDDWCREDDIPFRLFPGWMTRSRSSGGFDAVWGVVAHHTASNTTWQNDAAYEWLNAATRPIGNVNLDRSGIITIGAAGATNTNGRGAAPWRTSKGVIPIEPTTMGNRMAFAIEAANNGVGEPWPRRQMDTYIRFMAMLCRRLGLDPMRDVQTHQGWAGPRKVDPFGPATGYPSLGTRTWPTTPLRELVRDVDAPDPDPVTPPPATDRPGKVTTMKALVLRHGGTPTGGWSAYYCLDGGFTRLGINSPHQANQIMALGAIDAKTLQPVTSWSQVTWTGSAEELDEWLTPGRD